MFRSSHDNHISVCVCTYKRPLLLARLLNDLRCQETGGQFTYSIVVSDNDAERSAEATVSAFAASSIIGVKYCVAPLQGISHARNKAVENAVGHYIAFIDDDEVPERTWLHALFTTCKAYGVDGVLGPVKPSFDPGVPRWILRGGFYERPCHETGAILSFRQTRTGNVLLRESLFRETDVPFRPEFRSGEDQDFFARAMARGRVFIWCNEAVAYESVPPSRWRRSYLIRRALLRGAGAALLPNVGALNVTKSVAAVVIYGCALPFAAPLGQHRFMDLLVRLCDHLGKLLALVGVNPIAGAYVTE